MGIDAVARKADIIKRKTKRRKVRESTNTARAFASSITKNATHTPPPYATTHRSMTLESFWMRFNRLSPSLM
jgi:hypothetical protein